MLDQVRDVVASALHVESAAGQWTSETLLLGNLPELDSLAVINVLTALEERFGFHVEDDEVTGDIFLTLGTLSAFVEEKVARLGQ